MLRNFLLPNDVSPRRSTGLAAGEALSADERRGARARSWGAASEVQTAAFLIALRTKGASVEEITGLARPCASWRVPVDAGGDLVDTAGTGGGRPTFNVSTTAALPAGRRLPRGQARQPLGHPAAADRRTSWRSWGWGIDLAPERVAECIRTVGFGFMFAPSITRR